MNKIAKNFLSTSFANLIGQVFLFLITAYYASIIGEGSYGEVMLAQQIIMYFSTTVIFGIQIYGTRIISSDKKSVNKIVGEASAFRLFIAAICFIVIICLAIFLKENYTFKLMLIIFGLTLFPIALSMDWVYNGLQEMQHNAVFALCKNLIPCVLIFTLLNGSKNLYIIPLSMVIGLVIGVIYQYFIFLRKDGYKLNIIFSKDIIIKYTAYGFPFLVQGLLGMINNNADKLILGFTRTDAELGIYQAAYNFISFLIMVDALIFTPVFPLLAEYYFKNKKEKLEFLCEGIAKIISLVAVPVLFGGILLSKDLLKLFYKGKGYQSGYQALNVLLVYILILFFREIFAYQLNAWKMEKKYLKIVGISALCNLIFNLFAIPKFGMIGAAWVTTITEIINLIFMRKYAIRIVKTNCSTHILKAIPPAILMAISIYIFKYIRINILVNIIFAICIYVLAVLSFRVITLCEIKKFLIKEKI